MYTPDRATFEERAQHGNLVPVWRELLADQETPVSAYKRVRKFLRERDDASHTYLLESVEGGENIGRYSFIGGTPRTILRAYGRRVEIVSEPAAVAGARGNLRRQRRPFTRTRWRGCGTFPEITRPAGRGDPIHQGLRDRCRTGCRQNEVLKVSGL